MFINSQPFLKIFIKPQGIIFFIHPVCSCYSQLFFFHVCLNLKVDLLIVSYVLYVCSTRSTCSTAVWQRSRCLVNWCHCIYPVCLCSSTVCCFEAPMCTHCSKIVRNSLLVVMCVLFIYSFTLQVRSVFQASNSFFCVWIYIVSLMFI